MYNRAIAREAKIWKPFGYSFPFTSDQIAERLTIMGLYACSYLNNHKYLREIETEELAYLLADYNSKLAELTMQQQIVVADISGKRYLASIDKLIHDQKMITKEQGIDYDNALMDAKIAALESDRAALATMAAKVTAETEKTQARIAELEAYIQIEGINLSYVEIEILEKEIRSAKLDNEKLQIANEILRIQVETVEAAMQLIDIDLRIASTKVDIAQTQRNIAKLGLLQDDLLIEQAKTSIEEAGIPISRARIRLAQAKYDDAVAEEAYMRTLLTKEADNYTNRKNVKDADHAAKTQSLNHRKNLADADNSLKIDLSNLGLQLTSDDATSQENIDNIKVGEINQRGDLAWSRAWAAIAAEEKVASAKITTNLTHTVQKA